MASTETAVVVPVPIPQAGAEAAPNPLISAQKSSDLHAVLHPLVLLNISDYITRHTLRNQQTPIVGALLGQQNGREITLEHAFDAHLEEDSSVSGGWILQLENFAKRVEQMRTVHKDRSLELVGWYTMIPRSGPSEIILPIHNQILSQFNESAILLGFYGAELVQHRAGGKLPIVIYESNYEVDDSAPRTEDDGEDTKMDDGEQQHKQLRLKFRELPYSVEMSDAEMISMNYVAQGRADASLTAPAPDQEQQQKKTPIPVEAESRGKRRAVEKTKDSEAGPSGEVIEEEEEVVLSAAEEDLIATLTTKANAVRMLQSRINLIVSYLEGLPDDRPRPKAADEIDMPDAPGTQPDSEPMKEDTPQPQLGDMAKGKTKSDVSPSTVILRQIQALVTRLDLVVPSDVDEFRREIQRERNDIALIEHLNAAITAIHGAWGSGKKFSIVEASKRNRRERDVMSSSSLSSPWAGDVTAFAAKAEEKFGGRPDDPLEKGTLDEDDLE